MKVDKVSVGKFIIQATAIQVSLKKKIKMPKLAVKRLKILQKELLSVD